MLRKRRSRGMMWAAAGAFLLTAAVSWWNALENSATGSDLIAPIGFTVASLTWLVNVLVARVVARAAEGADK